MLVEALEDSPVGLIDGPRQCEKTTLVQIACAPSVLTWRSEALIWRGKLLSRGCSPDDPDYSYFSFDDPIARDSARSDPMGFIADLLERVILGEVQKVLLEAIMKKI